MVTSPPSVNKLPCHSAMTHLFLHRFAIIHHQHWEMVHNRLRQSNTRTLGQVPFLHHPSEVCGTLHGAA